MRRRTTASGERRSTGRSATGTCSSCSAFSDENEAVTRQLRLRLAERLAARLRRTRESPNSGGLNWSATYTGYLTETLSMKVLYGENEREFSRFAANDVECARVRDLRAGADAGERVARAPRTSQSEPTRARRPDWTSSGSWALISCASAWTTRATCPSTSSSIRVRNACCTKSTTPAALRSRTAGWCRRSSPSTCARAATRSTANSRRSTPRTTSKTTGRSPIVWC